MAAKSAASQDADKGSPPVFAAACSSASKTRTAPVSMPTPTSVPNGGVSLSLSAREAARRAPALQSPRAPRRRGSAHLGHAPAPPSPKRRTPRSRTRMMASAPSARPLAEKYPTTVLAMPFSMRAGKSLRSESARRCRWARDRGRAPLQSVPRDCGASAPRDRPCAWLPPRHARGEATSALPRRFGTRRFKIAPAPARLLELKHKADLRSWSGKRNRERRSRKQQPQGITLEARPLRSRGLGRPLRPSPPPDPPLAAPRPREGRGSRWDSASRSP
jgi:hypothetical protein